MVKTQEAMELQVRSYSDVEIEAGLASGLIIINAILSLHFPFLSRLAFGKMLLRNKQLSLFCNEIKLLSLFYKSCCNG